MSEQLTAEESAAMAALASDPGETVSDAVNDPPAEEAAPVQAEVPDAKPQDPADDQRQQSMVPQGALHQERERRKEAERKLQEVLAQIEAAKAPPQEIVVPDPIRDPEGFKRFQVEQIKRQAEALAQLESNQRAALEDQAKMARLTQDVGQFRAQNPDYDAALQYAVKARREELALFGNPPDVIESQLEVDMRALVDQAYSQGRNPAGMFYDYAKTRGYSPAAPAVPQQSEAAAQVTALAEAQRRSQSIGTVGGPSGGGDVTLASFARMSEREMAAIPAEQRAEMLRKAMGG